MTNKKAIFLLIALTATMSSFDAIAGNSPLCKKLKTCIINKLEEQTDIQTPLQAILLCPKEIKEVASELTIQGSPPCELNLPMLGRNFVGATQTYLKNSDINYAKVDVKQILEDENKGYILYTGSHITSPCNIEPKTEIYGGEYVFYVSTLTSRYSNTQDRMIGLESTFSKSLRTSIGDDKVIAAYSPWGGASYNTQTYCPLYKIFTNGATYDKMTTPEKYRYAEFYVQPIYHKNLLDALVLFHDMTTNVEQLGGCEGVTFWLVEHDSTKKSFLSPKDATESATRVYDKDGLGYGTYDINLLELPYLSGSCVHQLDKQLLHYTF